MYVYNPQPGQKVQCPYCSENVVVGGRGQHRWIDCNECGRREEWHDNVAAGVVCKCPADFCPAHGKTKKLKEPK